MFLYTYQTIYIPNEIEILCLPAEAYFNLIYNII